MQTFTDDPGSISLDSPQEELHQVFSGDEAPVMHSIEFYEAAISTDETVVSNYWYLGLAYLLQQRELDAQSTWFIPFAEASELETAALTNQLSDVLDRFANQELTADNLDNAWLISQYLREIDSTHIQNLFRSILLTINLKLFTPEDLVEWQGVEILSTYSDVEVTDILKYDRLELVLASLLDFPSEFTCEFIHQCLVSFPTVRSQSIQLISDTVLNLSHRFGSSTFMTKILEICLEFQPQNIEILQIFSRLSCNLGEYQRAIDSSLLAYSYCYTLAQKITTNANIIRTLLTAGDWQNVLSIVDRHYQLFETFITENPDILEPNINRSIMISATFLPYIADRPDYYRKVQNQIAKNYLDNHQAHIQNYDAPAALLPKQPEKIRIGYLGSTLRSHSVGWLSRWIWQYHDREKFQIFTYCINQNPDNPFYQKWFGSRSDVSYCMVGDGERVAAQIRADKIDILIDLDSLTLSTTCQVLATKPAPIQVSWLGWDATGLPTVDYFIADRYVLPENAQDYYQEKIWRLPQSYVAVDGFEVGISTIRREDLNIPCDAIVYWSGQRGYKRHPQTIRLQLQILKAVPNSYLLIKGESDRHTIESLFAKIATEIGVDLNRLRFLNTVADEVTHRANLAIADIVLDTFPYNGATTTLETLWMGIPMVTQVGQQFAARNSYTFMLNAGIEEGIAWNQEEYVEWGIKLGLDRDLRDKIAGKLRSGRTTAPVWNAKQFTLDMEEAYRQMWAIYQDKQQEVVEDYSHN
jgi:predicted O-linked N-acetylglucosamine transferase (SPINDLY family)